MSDGIKTLVENPHNIYRDNLHYWNFLLNSYEGGIDYTNAQVQATNNATSRVLNWATKVFAGGKEIRPSITSNLFEHPKERREDYESRVKLSYYYNFCAPIVDIYTNHLFKQSIVEEWGTIQNVIDKRENDVDLRGDSIAEFRKELADVTQIYGHGFVLIDSPKANVEIRTQADQISNNIFPYMNIYHPQNILNWALDNFGRPYWVLIQEDSDVNIDPFNFDRDATTVKSYRLWTRTEWVLYNEKFEITDKGTHRLGQVPLVVAFDKPSKKARNFLGISSLADISFIARDVYNLCSQLNQIIRDQTFAFLAVQGESSEYDELTIGTSKGLLYPTDRNAPQYLSPPPANAEVIMKQIDNQIDKMFRLAKLEGGCASFEGQTAVEKSGVSKAWDFNETNSTLSKKAGYLQDAETKIWDTVARWEGKEFDGRVDYPKTFDIKSLNDDLEEAKSMLVLGLGENVNKEVKKSIIRKRFPRLPDDELEQMFDGIEDNEKTAVSRLKERMLGQFNANSSGIGGFNARRTN